MKYKIIFKILLFICYAILLSMQIAYMYINNEDTYEIGYFTGYLSLSSSVIILILIFSSKLHLLPERIHYSTFPLTYLKFLIIKVKYFVFYQYFVLVLLIYLSYLFNEKIDYFDGLLFFFCTVCQYLFTILLYFVLWDILCIKNLNKHINMLFFLSLFPSIILGNSINNKYLFLNPISNTISLPIIFLKEYNNFLFAISFFIIPLLFFLVYFLLIRNVKQWN